MAMAQSTSDRGDAFHSRLPEIRWPLGKTFAFTVFDDPDFQTREKGEPVYNFLADCGILTTKGIFPGTASTPGKLQAVTCNDPGYLDWVLKLHERGFEMGWHGASPETSRREQTAEALNTFHRIFGHWPFTSSQHYECMESVYWGDQRLTSQLHKFVYNAATRWRNHDLFHGDQPGHELYWGDLCRDKIGSMRNFVYPDINTLAACPFMPYYDPQRPDVNRWYASTNGHNSQTFLSSLSEKNQDRLESEGGACIIYTHFAYGFTDSRRQLLPEFRRLIERLGRKNGWFVPVKTLLDYLAAERTLITLRADQRRKLERRWLSHKLLVGTT
jgi:hypothetical protein